MKIHHPFLGNTLVIEKDAKHLMLEIFRGSASRLRDLFVTKQCFFNASLDPKKYNPPVWLLLSCG